MTYLPTSDDREVHGGCHIRAPHGLEALTLIPDNCAESLHSSCLGGNLRARKLVSDINRRQRLAISVPKFPVKLLDALVATVCDFMDGCRTHRRFVLEVQKERHGNTPTFLKDGDVDVTGRGRIQNAHDLEVNDRCRRHNDFLTGTWSEETSDGVINVRSSFTEDARSFARVLFF
jgi:hypothetical protein